MSRGLLGTVIEVNVHFHDNNIIINFDRCAKKNVAAYTSLSEQCKVSERLN